MPSLKVSVIPDSPSTSGADKVSQLRSGFCTLLQAEVQAALSCDRR